MGWCTASFVLHIVRCSSITHFQVNVSERDGCYLEEQKKACVTSLLKCSTGFLKCGNY